MTVCASAADNGHEGLKQPPPEARVGELVFMNRLTISAARPGAEAARTCLRSLATALEIADPIRHTPVKWRLNK
jgi:hypothetical protein